MSSLQPSPRDLAGTGRIYPQGHYAEIRVAELVWAPERVAQALGIAQGAPAIRRERVHCNADGAALSVSTSWFSGLLAPDCPRLLERERIVEGTANYIGSCTNRAVVRGPDAVAARVADQAEAELLDVPVGSPVQLVTTYWFDSDNAVLEFGESLRVDTPTP